MYHWDQGVCQDDGGGSAATKGRARELREFDASDSAGRELHNFAESRLNRFIALTLQGASEAPTLGVAEELFNICLAHTVMV